MKINGPAERKWPNQPPEHERENTIRQAWVVSLNPSLPCDGGADKPEEGWSMAQAVDRNSDLKRGSCRVHQNAAPQVEFGGANKALSGLPKPACAAPACWYATGGRL